ncbi:MAG: hypothetical protein MJE63_00395, partial [Proteobacteria bacterium]|nr:hypothetical protein [Pseudomonadota bacterium]
MTIKNPSIKFKFGTKAETLEELQKLKLPFLIPDFFYFNLKQWNKDPNEILNDIVANIKSELVAVRSSAACEDGAFTSNAGAFTSLLNIVTTDRKNLKKAIDTVFESYPNKNDDDQVLIQKMVKQIQVCGVILTRSVDDGSPYYVLSYDDESGNTDNVTGGKGVH